MEGLLKLSKDLHGKKYEGNRSKCNIKQKKIRTTRPAKNKIHKLRDGIEPPTSGWSQVGNDPHNCNPVLYH